MIYEMFVSKRERDIIMQNQYSICEWDIESEILMLPSSSTKMEWKYFTKFDMRVKFA
jgi:hypothetical protein